MFPDKESEGEVSANENILFTIPTFFHINAIIQTHSQIVNKNEF